MALATLGPVAFEVSDNTIRTWQQARRSLEARWHSHAVHLAKPKPEFLGPGAATLQLQVRLDIALGIVPLEELRQLRDLCDTGEVVEFVIGDEVEGDWTVQGVSEAWTRTDADGVIEVAIVDLSLGEYN